MQEFATPHSLRNGIFDLLSSVNLASEENVKLLDYTIELFNKNGLSSDYYGYHNIDHELEVTYVTLISAVSALNEKKFTLNDVRYLYASALYTILILKNLLINHMKKELSILLTMILKFKNFWKMLTLILISYVH